MVGRCFLTLVLGFALSTIILTLLPDLGRIAGPFVCEGTLEPGPRSHGLHYRCITAEGQAFTVAPDQVAFRAIPLIAVVLMIPIYAFVRQREVEALRAQQAAEADLAKAVPARAEVLRIVHSGNLKRQLLLRAAELNLVLWVQPPNGRPYEAQVDWIVEEDGLGWMRIGAVVPVRINPLRPQKVYPAQPWAHYAWWSAS
ncbi:MAG: hypothetical protein RMK84_12610 [Oscillochloridaceae bacterium]|nr:hypothetical protein [Chloroflexaceae bacterium]MDW8390961.1 hypothetical protein [Oscillochloridaceae bacterium]